MSAIDTVRTETHPVDIYYQRAENQGVQAVPTEVTTRFVQVLSNLSSGTSTILLPPQDGLSKLLLVVGYDQAQVSANTGGAYLERGWSYSAVRSVTWRVGSSNTFTLTGAQLLARNLRMATNSGSKDAVISLGGSACTLASDFQNENGLYGYIPLTFFNGVETNSISLPVATDCLSSQVVIQIELNPPSAFWRINPNPGATVYTIPASFAKGYVQTEQLLMKNKADSLAVRFDLNKDSYIQTMVDFDQTAFTYQLPGTPGLQSITVSGIRSGQCKGLQIWLYRKSDLLNPSLAYAPRSVQIQYSGQFYSFFNDGTSDIWALMDNTSAPAANTVKFAAAAGGGGAMVASPALHKYALCPFAQPIGWDMASEVNAQGKVVSNSSIQVGIELPWTPVDANDGAIMVLVPSLANVLAYSRGSADYIF